MENHTPLSIPEAARSCYPGQVEDILFIIYNSNLWRRYPQLRREASDAHGYTPESLKRLADADALEGFYTGIVADAPFRVSPAMSGEMNFSPQENALFTMLDANVIYYRCSGFLESLVSRSEVEAILKGDTWEDALNPHRLLPRYYPADSPYSPRRYIMVVLAWHKIAAALSAAALAPTTA